MHMYMFIFFKFWYLPSFQLYVRIFSLRDPVPTCQPRFRVEPPVLGV